MVRMKKKTKNFHVELPMELFEAFERLRDDEKRGKKDQLVVILEKHLRAQGYLPPRKDASGVAT